MVVKKAFLDRFSDINCIFLHRHIFHTVTWQNSNETVQILDDDCDDVLDAVAAHDDHVSSAWAETIEH